MAVRGWRGKADAHRVCRDRDDGGRRLPVASLRPGHRLTVYDVRPEAIGGDGRARGRRARRQPQARAAYGAEVVFTSLPGPSEVEATALDPERGILAGFAPRRHVYRFSPPMRRRRCGLWPRPPAKSARIAFSLDAPVSGRPPNMTVDGRRPGRPIFAHCRSLFDANREECLPCRAERGAGCAAKLVTQYLGYTNFIAANRRDADRRQGRDRSRRFFAR